MRNVLYVYIDIKVSYWWDDDDALFQIDQHALLDLCPHSQKQQIDQHALLDLCPYSQKQQIDQHALLDLCPHSQKQQIDQHALLDLCPHSQKQQSSCRLGAPQHNILIFNQSVLAVIP
jgi:nitrite reductase/ring-hydroxylating ferredoxin subunit